MRGQKRHVRVKGRQKRKSQKRKQMRRESLRRWRTNLMSSIKSIKRRGSIDSSLGLVEHFFLSRFATFL
jgi:hypothetical protein